MTDTLTARLLAEIERREGRLRSWLTVAASDGWDAYLSDSIAYLAALRKIVKTAAEGITSQQGGEVRFAEIIAAVAEGLGVAL